MAWEHQKLPVVEISTPKKNRTSKTGDSKRKRNLNVATDQGKPALWRVSVALRMHAKRSTSSRRPAAGLGPDHVRRGQTIYRQYWPQRIWSDPR